MGVVARDWKRVLFPELNVAKREVRDGSVQHRPAAKEGIRAAPCEEHVQGLRPLVESEAEGHAGPAEHGEISESRIHLRGLAVGPTRKTVGRGHRSY